jgi:hypothetical protein
MFQDLELIELLVAPGPLRQDHAAALFKNRLYRRWGIKTAREYAQIKIDGLRRVGGTRTSPTRPGTATTTHASTTGSKLYVPPRC